MPCFNGLGTCHCGRCKCDNSDGNGLVYGKFCECDDRECIDDETEEICGGMYINFAKNNISTLFCHLFHWTFISMSLGTEFTRLSWTCVYLENTSCKEI